MRLRAGPWRSGGGVVAIDGVMYDRPHLVRAQRLIARSRA